jgi:hypothetical protein
MDECKAQDGPALRELATRLHSYPMTKRLSPAEVVRVRRELLQGFSTEHNANPNMSYTRLMATLEARAVSILRWIRSADVQRARQ